MDWMWQPGRGEGWWTLSFRIRGREFNLDMDIDAFVELARRNALQGLSRSDAAPPIAGELSHKGFGVLSGGCGRLELWDVNTTSRAGFKDEWSMVRRLGHKDELEGWKADGRGVSHYPLREVGGVVMDEYSPYDAS